MSKKIGFWATFFDDDISWREASAINEAHTAIAMNQAASASNDRFQAQQLQKLFALDRAQARQLERMSARVRERVQQVEAVEAANAERGPTATCAACRAEVPAKNTQITTAGTVCDTCYYRGLAG